MDFLLENYDFEKLILVNHAIMVVSLTNYNWFYWTNSTTFAVNVMDIKKIEINEQEL
jgi:hypothetical protein